MNNDADSRAPARKGPLTGTTLVELGGIGPGPYCGQLLGDLGAQVIVIDRPGMNVPMVERRGKKSIVVNMREKGAVSLVRKIVAKADMAIEGFRPGVAERLGVGPEDCLKDNPALVYGRMTGWGQTGPWASMAGHDINYLGITGALHAMGEAGRPPSPPLNLVGDYGGGSLFLAMGMLAALSRARTTGVGDVVDAAIIDGVASMFGIIRSLDGLQRWTTDRAQNVLDGGAPFYRCFETADHKFMAVGAIEPQFFEKLLSVLTIDPDHFGDQRDEGRWPEQHKILEKTFSQHSRDHWAALFDGVDACVTPVLDYNEAPLHPQNIARGQMPKDDLFTHPLVAPSFSSGTIEPVTDIPKRGQHTDDILKNSGYSADDIEEMKLAGIVHS